MSIDHTICPYCGQQGKLVRGETVYPHRPDLALLYLWECAPCGARVGTHLGSPTHEPFGRMAKLNLRILKKRAHALFDPLHRDLRAAYPEATFGVSKRVHVIARNRAYNWLAEIMNIPAEECHIAMFDEERCEKAIRVLEILQPTSLDIRLWAKQKEIANHG